jgi:hypothetical protein
MPNAQIVGGRDFSEKVVVTCRLVKEFLANSLPYIPCHFPLDPILSQINSVNPHILFFYFYFGISPIVVKISHFVTRVLVSP